MRLCARISRMSMEHIGKVDFFNQWIALVTWFHWGSIASSWAWSFRCHEAASVRARIRTPPTSKVVRSDHEMRGIKKQERKPTKWLKGGINYNYYVLITEVLAGFCEEMFWKFLSELGMICHIAGFFGNWCLTNKDESPKDGWNHWPGYLES